ncbi:uncharacterized protein EDB91DRAFT_1055313, partial [Suillus paluster]|uniref:uncharacterized protein n=1 Tax=Suillus paluster TaxID=48578 RepID=UPI001B8867EB
LKHGHRSDYLDNHYPPLNLLIAHFKYTELSKIIEDDEETRRWWRLADRTHKSCDMSRKEIPWWTDVEEVFRFEGGS